MTRRVQTLVAVLAVAWAGTAATGESRLELRATAGWSSPGSHTVWAVQDDSLYKTGLTARLEVGWAASQHLVVAAGAGYSRLPFDPQNHFYDMHRFYRWWVREGHAATMLSAGICVRATLLPLGRAFVPYAIVGADRSRMSHEVTIESEDASVPPSVSPSGAWTSYTRFAQARSEFWLTPGFGAELRLSRSVGFCVEIRRRYPLHAEDLPYGALALRSSSQTAATAGIVLRP
jgi:hypothetical protein